MQSLILNAVLLTAALFLPLAQIAFAQAHPPLTQLPDGLHQFCTKPEPKDWQLGAGVCFWFRKQGSSIVGYYGYPHSDRLIDCLSGQIQAQRIIGQALFIDWAGDTWQGLRHSSTWDAEGHLTLKAKPVVHPVQAKVGQLALVQIRSISLDLVGFYEYSAKKVRQMKSPPKTCELSAWRQQAASNFGALP